MTSIIKHIKLHASRLFTSIVHISEMVLKGIPSILSPDLLHALASMGHGDKIVIADANFPSASICNGEESPRLVRADGHSIPHLLEAILKLMPLDTYVFSPVWLMDLVNRDKNSGMGEPPVWSAYQQIINQAENREISVNKIERWVIKYMSRK